MKQLAQHLGLSEVELKKRWKQAGLDGDEQASLADVFHLDIEVPPDGRVSNGKITSGLTKLSTQFDKPQPKRKTKRKPAK